MRHLNATCACVPSLAAAASLRAAVTLLLVGLLSTTSTAATTNWNVGTGIFNATGSWDNGVPGADDLAVFRRGDVPAYSVTFGTLLSPISPTINRLIVGTNTLSFNVATSSLIVDEFANRFGFMTIGDTASDVAVLTSNLANLSAHDATLGSAAGSSGILNLTAGTATFNVTSVDETYDLAVGSSGTGAINITGGADVTVADDTALGVNATSVGNVSVSGPGSTWSNTGDLTVGGSGTGMLNLSSGGQLSNAIGYLGHSAGSNGSATIDGNGSLWTNGTNLYVGYLGNGMLNITGGGDVVNNNLAHIGHGSGTTGSVTVSGAGSTWTNPTNLNVGVSGDGTLDINSGGQVSSGFVGIGFNAGSTGEASISGANSMWSNTTLVVGHNGDGALHITGGGQANNITGYVGNQSGSMGEVTVNGAGSSWSNSVNLYVGNTASGTLDVTAGGAVSDVNGYIGDDAGSNGEVSVNGMGSTWTNSADLYVGNAGTGTLTVTTGGAVHSNGDLYVGNAGTGALDITAGGHVTSTVAYIGSQDGSVGEATIDGVGSLWSNARVIVGNDGDGTMHLTNGGMVDTSDDTSVGIVKSAIGASVGSTGVVTVDGTGSRWKIHSSSRVHLDVGLLGDGTLQITNGGRIDIFPNKVLGSASLDIGTGSTGIVTVDGSGSGLFVNNSDNVLINIGFNGNGTLNVTNGGMVVFGQGVLRVGFDGTLNINSGGLLGSGSGGHESIVGGNGIATIDGPGSTWTSAGHTTVAGTLTIMNGGMFVGPLSTVPTLFVEWSGRIRGDGNIAANVMISGNNVYRGEVSGGLNIVGDVENHSGLVSPGTSPGALNIDGNYSQAAEGELLIELAPTGHDQLLVTGDVTLDGALTVKLIDGFIPSSGQSFAFLASDDVDGTFASELLPSLPGLLFDVIYNPTSVVLTVSAVGVPGDYNQNGTVDAGDYVVWRKNLGSGMSLPNDDTPGVGPEDYTRWRANFSQTAGSGTGASVNASVPEPTTLVLLMFGAASWSLRRGRAE